MMSDKEKAPAGQSRGSNALSQQHGFYCVTQYHNSMVRKGSELFPFYAKRAAYASRTSNPKVKHLIHLSEPMYRKGTKNSLMKR